VVTLGDVTLAPSANLPIFTVDPISLPNATQDVAYTGQSITNSATDADGDTITYSKLLGPTWLSIASNGDLSGTPASTDSGPNSWIVQASDGFNTDTAVLSINVTGSGGGSSSIAINYEEDSGWNVPGGTSSTSSYTGVSAQLGDVIVLTVSGNKKGNVAPLSSAKVGGTGAVGIQSEVKNDLNTYPTSWAWHYTVTGTGTFDVDITTDNTAGITALTALYVVRADSGVVALADSATWDDTDDAANPASHSLDYTFASALTDGVVIESASARLDGLATPSGYTQDRTAAAVGTGFKRSLLSFDGVTGTSWSSVYTITDDAAHNTSGGVGMVFSGVGGGGGNAPPVFDSNPVSEAGATQDEVYTSTLADNASDADFDSMTFAKIAGSGPTWLSVASNGALSGTPLVGDLGANSWQVSVTDGTSTNFANLQIFVSAPIQVVTPQNGTNILFIAIDDINPVLGCYGDPLAISPNIDGLASNGVTFLNAHCQWSVCGPSRASLMTGIMPEETGVTGFRKMRGDAVDAGRVNTVKRPNVVTIPQYFRYNGYRTAAVGKINDYRCVGTLDTGTFKVAEDGAAVDDPPSWGEPVDPNALPVDFFSNSAYVQSSSGWSPAGKPSVASNAAPDSTFTDGIICDDGITLLQNLATNDTQFFLGVGFKKPHLAFTAPQQYWDMHTNTAFSIAEFQDHSLNEVSYTWNYGKELAAYDEFYDPIGDPGGTGISTTNIPAWKQLQLLHGYYACVSFIDAQVGRLLAELETQGLADNTIVVLWGDHGFHLGDHAEWAKHTNLERATRVPFIIHNPFTGQSNVKTETPAALMDIYPTLCEMVGLPIPEQPLAQLETPTTAASGRSLKGKSLAGVVNGTTNSVRTGAVNLFSRSGHNGYAYRTDRYRYTEWVNKASNVVAERELYDYVNDPLETVNLAGEPGFDALMYSFSVSMREEFEQMKLSAGDIAAAELQGSPVYNTTAGNLSLAGLGISSDEVSWPDATGVTYNLMSKTNLMDASWSTNQTGLTESPVVIPQTEQEEFYKVDVN